MLGKFIKIIMIINKFLTKNYIIVDNYWVNLRFLDSVYKQLSKGFSKAYLSGSDWYIGDSLINNYNFVYPPNRFLMLYGICNEFTFIKSKYILYILSIHLKNNFNLV